MPGGLYHIYSRGIDGLNIFEDPEDREKFLTILSDTLSEASWRCFAYCLMRNHYHILIETADGDTSIGMKRLNGLYAQYFNWKHERVGPLFQGRYKAILVDRENYFLELCRYIVLNPVRAGLSDLPEDYRWSSYRVTAGLDEGIGCIDRETVLQWFTSVDDTVATSARRYASFVGDGLNMEPAPFDVNADLILGDRDFVKSLKKRVEKKMDDTSIPKYQRTACRPALKELLDPLTASMKNTRDEAVRTAYSVHGYTQTAIARHLGIHNSTVFRIINKR